MGRCVQSAIRFRDYVTQGTGPDRGEDAPIKLEGTLAGAVVCRGIQLCKTWLQCKTSNRIAFRNEIPFTLWRAASLCWTAMTAKWRAPADCVFFLSFMTVFNLMRLMANEKEPLIMFIVKINRRNARKVPFIALKKQTDEQAVQQSVANLHL